MEMPIEYKRNLYRGVLSLVIILCVFYAVRSLSEFSSYRRMDDYGGNTITLSGHGEVEAVPDIANIYFTIRKEGKTVSEAQDAVAVVEKSSLDFLKANNIEDKDIKTSNASFNPKYEYNRAVCPQPPSGAGSIYYCGEGKQVLVGYEAYESITVKVRNTDEVGKIMQGLGGLGVMDLNGPNFSIDDEDALKAQARKEAIEDAREKAQVLAEDLGVRLGKIMNFSEDGDYPMPYYDSMKSLRLNSEEAAPSAPAQIPKGENTITSDVSITYEIK
jgi:uncharacterized protein